MSKIHPLKLTRVCEIGGFHFSHSVSSTFLDGSEIHLGISCGYSWLPLFHFAKWYFTFYFVKERKVLSFFRFLFKVWCLSCFFFIKLNRKQHCLLLCISLRGTSIFNSYGNSWYQVFFCSCLVNFLASEHWKVKKNPSFLLEMFILLFESPKPRNKTKRIYFWMKREKYVQIMQKNSLISFDIIIILSQLM